MSSAMTVMAVAASVAAAASIKNGMDQRDASSKAASQQEKAQQQAQSNADKAAAQADQDMNKANQKSTDSSALLAAAAQAGKSGASGTMLTGSQGVDPNALSLGKNTLLGG